MKRGNTNSCQLTVQPLLLWLASQLYSNNADHVDYIVYNKLAKDMVCNANRYTTIFSHHICKRWRRIKTYRDLPVSKARPVLAPWSDRDGNSALDISAGIGCTKDIDRLIGIWVSSLHTQSTCSLVLSLSLSEAFLDDKPFSSSVESGRWLSPRLNFASGLRAHVDSYTYKHYSTHREAVIDSLLRPPSLLCLL